uniref:uncharacterized protein LOC120341162 isoform X2 n=1 Tax=Styela clava TaxID=7725 RepID=UPI001939AD64|nr:uncharacterized protein LOC120341162 isoform X2 [Styela clava]
MLDFLLVEYFETTEVCVIPSNWLYISSSNNYRSYFPEIQAQKVLESYAKARVNPRKNWRLFNCRILFQADDYGSCENFLEMMTVDNMSEEEDYEVEDDVVVSEHRENESKLISGEKSSNVVETVEKQTTSTEQELVQSPPTALQEPSVFARKIEATTNVDQTSIAKESDCIPASQQEKYAVTCVIISDPSQDWEPGLIPGSQEVSDLEYVSQMGRLSDIHPSHQFYSKIKNCNKKRATEEEQIVKNGMGKRLKKLKRPCLYCGEFQTRLKRHLERIHAQEDAVREALGVDGEERIRKFNLLRKEGIYKHNLKMIMENKPIGIEKRNKGHIDLACIKICVLCRAFIRRKNFKYHLKNCPMLKTPKRKKNNSVPDFVSCTNENKDPGLPSLSNLFQIADEQNSSKTHKETKCLTKNQDSAKSVVAGKGSISPQTASKEPESNSECKELKVNNNHQLAFVESGCESGLQDECAVNCDDVVNDSSPDSGINITPNSPAARDTVHDFQLVRISETHSLVRPSNGIKKNEVKPQGEKKVMRKKPKRPCCYCGKLQAKLKRHLKAMHAQEDAVKEALKLDEKEEFRKFELLRKKGIYQYNLKLIKENKPIAVEKRQKNHQLASFKVCVLCNAFIGRKQFASHLKRCSNIGYTGEKDKSCAHASDLAIYENRKGDTGCHGVLDEFHNEGKGSLCKSIPNEKSVLSGQEQCEKKEVWKNLKKPKRPCVYCGKLRARVERHLHTIHAQEDAVKEALKSNIKEKMRKFDLLRKEGIYRHNLKMIKENKPIEVERRQYKSQTDLDSFKICVSCHAFIASNGISGHMKNCSSLKSSVENKSKCLLPASVLAQQRNENDVVLFITTTDSSTHKDDIGENTSERNSLPEKLEGVRKCSGSKSYFRWTKDDQQKVFSYFKEAVWDLSERGTKGSLPGKCEIENFLRKYPKLFKDLEPNKKISVVKAKIFNERTKFRENHFMK